MRKSLTNGVLAKGQHAPGDGFVRVGPLMNLPALVRNLGCDPEPIFTGAGFDTAQFTDPDFEIPFVRGSKLLAHCAAATGCGHLGLLLGKRAAPSSLGVTGFMLRTAPNVGTALQGLVSHLDLHDRGAVLSLVSDDRGTHLSYIIYLTGVEATYHIYDMSMTIACKIMRSLCGAYWNPAQVLLSRRPPQIQAPYKRFFRAPLRFNSDQNTLTFQTRWLDHQLESSDPLLHRHLEKEANELHALQDTGLVNEVRLLLRLSLKTQKSTLKAIAGQLGIHERTLNRRLREEGTSFRRELANIRYELARQMLADTKISLSEISISLNYADPTAFSRAFKQWSGLTPAEWRTRNLQ